MYEIEARMKDKKNEIEKTTWRKGGMGIKRI